MADRGFLIGRPFSLMFEVSSMVWKEVGNGLNELVHSRAD